MAEDFKIEFTGTVVDIGDESTFTRGEPRPRLPLYRRVKITITPAKED